MTEEATVNLLTADVLALTKLRRTRNNLGLIQEQLGELRQLADDAETVFETMNAAREAVQEFAASGDGDENPFTQDWFNDACEAADKFLESLPGNEGESISELVSTAEELAEEYEECLEDRDYSADDREEVWGNLLNALEDIAGVMK